MSHFVTKCDLTGQKKTESQLHFETDQINCCFLDKITAFLLHIKLYLFSKSFNGKDFARRCELELRKPHICHFLFLLSCFYLDRSPTFLTSVNFVRSIEIVGKKGRFIKFCSEDLMI